MDSHKRAFINFNSINTRMQLIIIFAFIFSFASIMFVSNLFLTKVINQSQIDVYSEKLDAIIRKLEIYYERYQKDDIPTKTQQDYQNQVLELLQAEYYQKRSPSVIYPFIIDADARVVMHPTRKRGQSDKHLYFISDIISQKNGHFDYYFNETHKWMIFRNFEGWDWYIGFAVPKAVKYFYARQLNSIVVILAIIILSIGLLTTSWFISKALRPIVHLADIAAYIASGEMDHEVEVQGPAEIKILSQSFHHMQVTIRNHIQELEQHRSKLEDLVHERTNKLEMAQKQLIQSEKLAAIGQLAAGVAHEINNPLGFIISNISNLETYLQEYHMFLSLYRNLENAQDQHKEEEVKAIKSQVLVLEEEVNFDYVSADIQSIMHDSLAGLERIKKIVNELRIFARMNDDELTKCQVKEILQEAVKIVSSELKHKADLTTEFSANATIECNKQKIVQVFVNLFINAVQAMDKKGKIWLKTYEQDDLICISISDNGQGIAKDHLNKIFDPFFTTKPVGVGTGLGLSIIYDIVKQHHGEIDVVSTLGKGTTFTLMFPRTTR